MNEIVLATDLGGTNLRVAAIDSNGSILCRTKYETPKSESADDIFRAISEAARECRKSVENTGRLLAVGVAAPATIDSANGVILKAPNLPALDGANFSKAIERELNLPVVLENDANSAAIGENWLGASRGYNDSICVTLGTGVGGGITLNGKILRGKNGTAGEIGHICVEPFGAPCGCGSRGCVEQYSSATAVVRIAHELENQYPKSVLARNFDLTSLKVYEAGKDGDELALEVFRRMGFYLGIALADLVNVLNPEIIVIGGGAAAGWDLFIEHAREQIFARAFKEPAESVKIVRAELGDDAGILGAARLAFDLRLDN
ncbi:MAG TPA: ROK family protein [Pyrinomonadaceae bacterium]|jgi:glucokinase